MTRNGSTAGDGACVLCGARAFSRLFEKRGWAFVRCTSCGLVSLDPLPSPEEIAAHHERSYTDGGYATFAAADEIRRGIARDRLERARRAAPPGPWLDVGCSTGAFVAAAVESGIDAEGLEISSVAVAQARQRGLRVHQGAVESFSPERRYAVITAFDVLEHLRDPLEFVRRLGDWLLPDGVLVAAVPNHHSMAARVMRKHWFYYAPPDHIHYFTPETLRRLLAQGGLTTVDLRPAYKPLTIDYAAEQLAQLTPGLAPLARAVGRILPGRLGARAWPLPLGEIQVVARRTAAHAARDDARASQAMEAR
ncbi:MAG TPA: class I SAM-dependent methyltransferase [Candidatus Binatia bacterium]